MNQSKKVDELAETLEQPQGPELVSESDDTQQVRTLSVQELEQLIKSNKPTK